MGPSGPARSAKSGRQAWAEGGTMSVSSAEAHAPPWPERPPEGVMLKAEAGQWAKLPAEA